MSWAPAKGRAKDGRRSAKKKMADMRQKRQDKANQLRGVAEYASCTDDESTVTGPEASPSPTDPTDPMVDLFQTLTNSGWIVGHCSPSASALGAIVDISYASSARLLPAALTRLGPSFSSSVIPVHLYTVTVSESFQVEIRMLGKVVPPPVHSGIITAALALDSAAATSTDTIWRAQIASDGVDVVVTKLAHQLLCGSVYVPCSGIAVTPEVQAHLQQREKAVMLPNGLFLGRDFTTIVAEAEAFPALDVHTLTECANFQGLPLTCIRHTNCHRMVATSELARSMSAGALCPVCSAWNTNSLCRQVRGDGTEYTATREKVTAASSKVSFMRQVAAGGSLLIESARNRSAEIARHKCRMRLELQKVAVARVKFKDGNEQDMSQIMTLADQAIQEGALQDDPAAAALFADKGIDFALMWKQQVQAATVHQRERAKNPAKVTTTGRGMRFHPTMMRWALRLFKKSRAAYGMIAELLYMPGARSVIYDIISSHLILSPPQYSLTPSILYRQLQDVLHWNKNEPGINTELLLLLQEKLAHITIRGLRQFIMM